MLDPGAVAELFADPLADHPEIFSFNLITPEGSVLVTESGAESDQHDAEFPVDHRTRTRVLALLGAKAWESRHAGARFVGVAVPKSRLATVPAGAFLLLIDARSDVAWGYLEQIAHNGAAALSADLGALKSLK